MLGDECWVMMKCAFEGTCLRLGVGCLLLGVDKVRIRGNMFVFGCLLWDDYYVGACKERICGKFTIQSIDITL